MDPNSVYESAGDPNSVGNTDGNIDDQAFNMQVRQRAQTASGSRDYYRGQGTDLVELNDYHNMVDETMIEPDYYIDMPPAAVYVPDEPGKNKETYLDERRDPDLFDFDAEVEPIL